MTEELPPLLAACTDGAALLDTEGTIQAANHAYASLHGCERNVLEGSEWPPDTSGEECEQVRETALVSARDSGEWRGTVTGRCNCETIHKSVTLSWTGDGTYLCLARDVTARVQREQRLRRQNERLDRFASVISHDLKEPLTIAMGKLELAKRECDVEHLADIDDAHKRMEELIDDVLTLAREGEAVGETEPVEIDRVARSTFEMLGEERAELTVSTDATPIEADPERLRTLFQNLFGNAIEHGAPDRRNVSIEVGSCENGFYVADDGPGIPPHERETVFEYGYSADEGTGLGLNIVHSIVDAHGWDIELTASRYDGARFEIYTT